MAKGNSGTGQGQYKPAARKSLTSASSPVSPYGGNDLLGSINTSIGGDAGYRNNFDMGMGGNLRYPGGFGGGMGTSVFMGSNPWNMGMFGGNMGMGWFDPMDFFRQPKVDPNLKSEKPTTPAAPAAPTKFGLNDASVKLRAGLNRDLNQTELQQLMGARGMAGKTEFEDKDIEDTLQYLKTVRPDVLKGAAPPIDNGGVARPMPTQQTPTYNPTQQQNPANLNQMNQDLRSRLTRDLSGDEIGMLRGALGDNLNVDAATNLIRQYMPSILR